MIRISEETMKICSKSCNFQFDSGYDEDEHRRFYDSVLSDEYIPQFQLPSLYNGTFMISSMEMLFQRNRVFRERTGSYLIELIKHRSVEKYLVAKFPNKLTLIQGMCNVYAAKQVKKELDVLFPWCRKVITLDCISIASFLKSTRTPFTDIYDLYMSLYQHLCGNSNIVDEPKARLKERFINTMLDNMKNEASTENENKEPVARGNKEPIVFHIMNQIAGGMYE